MKNLSFLFKAFVFQKRVVFLKISLLAIVLPLMASLSMIDDDPNHKDNTLTHSKTSNVLMCSIDTITTIEGSRSNCNDNGTGDYTDDFITIDIVVHFESNFVPLTGDLELTGPRVIGSWSVGVGSLNGLDSFIFDDVAFRSDSLVNDDIVVTATFTDVPSCTFTHMDAGYWFPPGNDSTGFRVGILKQCSVCPCTEGGACNDDYPGCWPVEVPNNPCSISENHAPDPGNPESLPIKHIKTVLHFFHLEDPDSLGTSHPTNPGNYTIDHLNLIESWFTAPGGVNWFLANMCDDTTDFSPHMPDARIRFLNEGKVGEDIFFHPDTERWGIGFNGCRDEYGISTGNWGGVATNYINTLPTESRNAYHVFFSGGKWEDDPLNDTTGIVGMPDSLECLYLCTGGFSPGSSVDCDDGNPPTLYQNFIYGNFHKFQRITDTSLVTECTSELDSNLAALGNQITGEIFHGLSIDHLSPLQAHKDHSNGDDGCEDTPWDSEFNMLGCDFDTRCGLTQCQIGRMHQFLTENQPNFLRYPTCDGGFSTMPEYCCIAEPDIVIPTGTDATWGGVRNLRSNVIVQTGASLTITCDLGMPEGARITVQTGGKLNVHARIHNNCDGTYWDGIVVEGDPSLGDFPEFQGFCKIVNGTIENAHIGVRCQDGTPGNNVWGGIVWAASSTFLNCEKYAVEINSFGNIKPPSYYATGDANDFAFCNFIRDDGYFGGTGAFQGMVKLKSVRGIRIVGCTFSNTGPGTNLQEMGDGVISQNAGFALQGFHVSGPIFNFDIPSNISGFRRGVFATYSYNTAIKITRSSFANNWIGIYANSCNNAMMLKNEFDVGSDLPLGLPAYADQANIGIALYRSRGYKIEENEFRRHPGIETMNPVRIQANASGPYSNEIYKNYFRDMFVSNVANGRNRTIDPNVGLQYYCNESQGGNTFDFSVKGGNNYPQAGIARNQGNTNLANGNTLTLPPPDSLTHFNNEEEDINYFHFLGTNETPTDYTNPTVTLIPLDFENLCASKLPDDFDGEISGSEKQQLSSDFYNSTVAGEKSYSANMLVHHFLTDSIEYNLDSARFWLLEMGGLENHMQVVNTYIGEKDIQAAQAALVAIPTVVALEGEELNEYAYFDSLKTIQINALGIDQPEEQMVIQNQNLLTGIANAGEYTASAEAKILLNTVIGELYPHEIFLPTNNNGQQMLGQPFGQELTSQLSLEEYYLKAAPNPAKNQTVFHFQLPDNEDKGQIRVTSIDGRTISVIELGNRNGKIAWNTEALKEGIYLFSLWADGKQMLTNRLVILH